MMPAAIVIPWRGGCLHREQALGWIVDRYRQQGFDVTVAEGPPGPWVKASAVNPAVEASSAELVAMVDADCWVPGLLSAIEAVADGAPWAIPHKLVHRLTEVRTAAVLAGADPADSDPKHDLDEAPYRGFAGGGCVVIPKATYLDVPLDPRFEGWSGEDESWARALSTLAGEPWRGDAPLFHLWHPPQPRMNRRHGSAQSQALTFNYRQAKGRPDRMRQIIEEARSWRRSSSTVEA
jgi:hypothetical protein